MPKITTILKSFSRKNPKPASDSKPPPSRTKIAFWALSFLVTLLVISKLTKFAISLNEPIDPNLIGKSNAHFNTRSTLNIALISRDISILNLQPTKKQLTILGVPNESYLEVPRNYGSWMIGAVYGLGQEETPQVGGILLRDSLSKLLGLPIDYIVIFNNNLTTQSIIQNWNKNLFSSLLSIKNLDSDLTPLQLASLIKIVNSLRIDKISNIDLYQSDITESKLLPDSSRVLGVNQIKLDLFIRDNLQDENIFQEGFSIAIYNSTDHPLLAGDLSRILTNIGANVVSAANSEKISTESYIIINDITNAESIKKSATLSRLLTMIPKICIKNDCLSDDQKINSSRGQIVINIGEDFYRNNYLREEILK